MIIRKNGQTNLIRMLQLADEVFGIKQDPTQISVDSNVRERLLKIHPATLSEKRNKDRPISWTLIFPTTKKLMNDFIIGKISEKKLLLKTPIGINYDSIYLCSALVLPEFRGKGIAKKMIYNSIKAIRKQHSVASLFYWEFSLLGKRLANSIAKKCKLPLLKKNK